MNAAALRTVFDVLREVLRPYAVALEVKRDSASDFYLDTRHIQKNKKPLFFGAVRVQKNYVSFHLMPVYLEPRLLDGVSERLMKRMHGKSCFNFIELDRSLAEELAALTAAGYAHYEKLGLVSPLGARAVLRR